MHVTACKARIQIVGSSFYDHEVIASGRTYISIKLEKLPLYLIVNNFTVIDPKNVRITGSIVRIIGTFLGIIINFEKSISKIHEFTYP